MLSVRTSRFVLAGALCAALLGAGCGGDSEEDKKAEYRADFEEASDRFTRDLEQAGATMRAAGQAKSREQYEGGVNQLRSASEEFREDLSDLDPPPEADSKQRALASAVDQFSTSVGAINAAVQADDEEQIQAEAARVQTSGAAVDRAIEDVKDAVR